jgi:hypothetical protein
LPQSYRITRCKGWANTARASARNFIKTLPSIAASSFLSRGPQPEVATGRAMRPQFPRRIRPLQQAETERREIVFLTYRKIRYAGIAFRRSRRSDAAIRRYL